MTQNGGVYRRENPTDQWTLVHSKGEIEAEESNERLREAAPDFTALTAAPALAYDKNATGVTVILDSGYKAHGKTEGEAILKLLLQLSATVDGFSYGHV